MFDDCFNSVVPVAVISQEMSLRKFFLLCSFTYFCMDFLKH